MGCSSCGTVGHFGSYQKAGPAQIMTNTGPVMSAPNASAGMHAQYMQNGAAVNVSGLGDIFGPAQTPWISGIQNEYIVAAAALLVVVMVMKG